MQRLYALVRQRRLLILILCIAVGFAVAVTVAALISDRSANPKVATATQVSSINQLFRSFDEENMTIGNRDAPVVISVWVDPRCPGCRETLLRELPDLLARLVITGEARLELQLLPVLGDDSKLAINGVRAAGEQGRAWPYLMIYLFNQRSEFEEYSTPDYLRDLARDLGLDDDRFLADLEQGRWDEANREASERALQEEVYGTPTIVVSGPGGSVKLNRAITIADIEQAVVEVGSPRDLG